MVGQFVRLSDTEMREQFHGRPVEELARVLRIPRTIHEPAGQERAEGGGGIHAADVIYLGARRRAAVQDDGEYFEPRLPDVASELPFKSLLQGVGGTRSDRKARFGLRLDERKSASLQPLRERIQHTF